MNSNACYNCGTVYRYQNGQRRCPICGSVITESLSAKAKKSLSAAFSLLGEEKFDEAKTAFEAVLQKYPESAEAYWGRLRARYHISYTPLADGKLTPTCPTRSGINIFEDVDFLKAMQYTDEEQRIFLQEQAERIKAACKESVSSKNFVNRFTFGEVDPNEAWMKQPKKIKKPIMISAVASFLIIIAVIGFSTGIFGVHQSGGLTFTVYEGNCYVGGFGGLDDPEIVIPSEHNGIPVIGIGPAAFYNCDTLTSVIIPDSVTSINMDAFSDCSALTSVDIPASVRSIGSQAFRDCVNLNVIQFGGTIAQWRSISFGMDWNLNTDNYTVICTDGRIGKEVISKGLNFERNENGTYTLTGLGTCTDTDIVIPSEYYGVPVTEIGPGAFHSYAAMTSVLIPSTVTGIGSSAFYGCKSLTNIVIPESVTRIDNFAFRNCSGLLSIVIPEGVTRIGDDTFWGCSSLTSVVIPQSVTRVGSTAFCFCRRLETIQFGGTTEQWNSIAFGSDWNKSSSEYVIVCTDGTLTKSGEIYN